MDQEPGTEEQTDRQGLGGGEGSYKPGGQLATLQLKVSGGEPVLLARPVGRGRRMALVGGGSVATCGPRESSASPGQGASTTPDQGLDRGANPQMPKPWG